MDNNLETEQEKDSIPAIPQALSALPAPTVSPSPGTPAKNSPTAQGKRMGVSHRPVQFREKSNATTFFSQASSAGQQKFNDAGGIGDGQGRTEGSSAEPSAEEGMVPIDYEPGRPSSSPPRSALDGIARLDKVPLLILHGRLDECAVMREIVARLAENNIRWICHLDDGSEGGGMLRLTDPDVIRKDITSIDQYKNTEATSKAVYVAELNYQDLKSYNAWQELLLTTKRDQLIRTLGDGNCMLIVAISIPNYEIDPRKHLKPDLSLEVPWPDMLIRKLCEEGSGTYLDDIEANRLQAILNQYLSSTKNRALDAKFFAALENIIDLPMSIEELEAEFTKRLSKVVRNRDSERQAAEADRPDTPDRYDVRNAVHETMVIVALFLGTISRIAFDRLVNELLPDENVPQDLLLPERRHKASTVTGSTPFATWSNPTFGSGIPASFSESATTITWRKSWAEDADLYRDQLNIYVKGTDLELGDIWTKDIQSVALLEKRQNRVELLARRIVQRGTIYIHDQQVAKAASKLLAALLNRLGMALDKASTLDIISPIIDAGLKSMGKPAADLIGPLSTLFDDISDAIGSAFPPVLYETLRDYARRNIIESQRCYIIASLCARVRDTPPRWHSGQKFNEIIRHIVSEANQQVRDTISDALFYEYRYTLNNATLRIDFLSALRSWLPSRIDQQPLLPTETLALQLWDDGLNRDNLWATPRTYEERGAKETLASVAFGQDSERRAELVRGLAAFRLEHVAMLETTESIWPLQNCFTDVFWMTLHGFQTVDARLVFDNDSRFALVFAAIAITDKPMPPDIIIKVFISTPNIENEDGQPALLDDIDAEVFQEVIHKLIKLREPLYFLPSHYKECLAMPYQSTQSTKDGRTARETLRKLDLFHAALIAEWFFLRFGIKRESLSDSEYYQVVALADTVCELDPEGLGTCLPSAFMKLARIVESYVPILNKEIKVSQTTTQAFNLKAKKLQGLSKLFAARAKDAAERSKIIKTSAPNPDR